MQEITIDLMKAKGCKEREYYAGRLGGLDSVIALEIYYK